MLRRLTGCTLLLSGCGQPAPAPVVVTVVPPVAEVAPAPTAPPVKPTPPALVTLPGDAGGEAVAEFLAPRALPDWLGKPATSPVARPVARFDVPLPAAAVGPLSVQPGVLPPLSLRRVGPRVPPEPELPSVVLSQAPTYALTPRPAEPWRLPPALDPLAPPALPATPRPTPDRSRVADPSVALTAERVAATPVRLSESGPKFVPPPTPVRLRGGPTDEVGTQPGGR